jgi:hypothetical protein
MLESRCLRTPRAVLAPCFTYTPKRLKDNRAPSGRSYFRVTDTRVYIYPALCQLPQSHDRTLRHM